MKNMTMTIAMLIAIFFAGCSADYYDPEGVALFVEIGHTEGGYTITEGPTGDEVANMQYVDCDVNLGLNGYAACKHLLGAEWFIIEAKPVEGYRTPEKIYFTGHGYAELFLNYETGEAVMEPEEPLACPQNVDDSCMIQEGGADCLLKASFAKSITEANRRIVADGKPEIRPLSCYQSS